MPHSNIKRQSIRGEASVIVPDRDIFRLHMANKRAPRQPCDLDRLVQTAGNGTFDKRPDKSGKKKIGGQNDQSGPGSKV
jgi:hypothetical protein